MKLQLIRNATMRVEYAGKLILTDPMLSPMHAIESFAGNSRNPVVDLPFPSERVVAGVDLVLASHVHQDHFDAAAFEMISKDIKVFCQPGDMEKSQKRVLKRWSP